MKDTSRISSIIDGARAAGRDALLETEGMALLTEIGIDVPRHAYVPSPGAIDEQALAGFHGDRLVVKAVVPGLLHKSDTGAVAVTSNSSAAVRDAIAAMAERLSAMEVEGYLLVEFVEHDARPGAELLLGLRWTEDFGAVVVAGAGGVYTEFLSKQLRPGSDTAVMRAGADRETVLRSLDHAAVVAVASKQFRGQPVLVERDDLCDTIQRISRLARFMPEHIQEFEINPLVATGGRLVALDVLATTGTGVRQPPIDRPVHKLGLLLEPRSAAVMGVSQRMNPGHVILGNMLRDGFDRNRLYVVKPGAETIDGCRCVRDIASLPERVDMLVLSVDARQAARAVCDVVRHEKAESIIIIPGGLEEKAGSEDVVARMHEALAGSRATAWQGPVVNGGNCLGILSRPGRYDTMFIPDHKIGREEPVGATAALISQSGAFAVSKNSKLSRVRWKYAVSIGNQMDLTVGDYLAHLADDTGIRVFAVYLEGFKPLDGVRFLEAAAKITESGRNVVLYAAGRTGAGAKASASHTASIAGDYEVTRALAGNTGVIVAESIADFEDLVTTFTLLDGRQVGRRVGVVSNAGFECVAIADNLGVLDLARFSAPTVEAITSALETARLSSIVDVGNPVDLTPIMDDAGYESVFRAILADDNVDMGVFGCVPLTPALRTLPPGDGHDEDVFASAGVAARIAAIYAESTKACVGVIDAGRLYDAMSSVLAASGMPVFRTADRALRLLNLFYRYSSG